MQALSPSELKAMLIASAERRPVLIDVREAWEIATASIAGTEHIPMNDIPARIEHLAKDAPTVVICHHGMRSLQVANFLVSHGFTQVFNLDGGIDAWSREVDPSVARY
jgi:rhodanese-related sulfurtransferase